jgi:hypothetical protein
MLLDIRLRANASSMKARETPESQAFAFRFGAARSAVYHTLKALSTQLSTRNPAERRRPMA